MREKLLTITIKDCIQQTFRAGGPGGQNQNKTSSGVRIIHPPSGARGESREGRGQLENKRKAFRRMAESSQMKNWIAAQIKSEDIPESSSKERIRTYNLVDRRVTDHRTKDNSAQVEEILNGNIDLLYK